MSERVIKSIYKKKETKLKSYLTIAGDQGLMFGYATDETEESMPLTIVLAHKLNAKLAEMRHNGNLWWAGPDGKSQVYKAVNPL